MMYEVYWKLERKPFEELADSRFFFPSETHQAALLKLRYLIENRKGAALLAGPGGSGKSLLIEELKSQLTEPFGPVITLGFPMMSPTEMLCYLTQELTGEILDSRTGLDTIVRRFQRGLDEHASRKQEPILIIDEAHLIEDVQVFQMLRLLINLGLEKERRFTMILTGVRELLQQVQRVPELHDRLVVRAVLRPLNYEETLGYLTHRWRAAGGKEVPFGPASMDALFEISGGIPRKINRLADLALLVGYADNCRTISVEQIEAISEELLSVATD